MGDSDAEVDPGKWKFGGWLRFQGSNIRRRRKNSPQRNEKEGSFTESPTSKERNSPSIDNLGLNLKGKVFEDFWREIQQDKKLSLILCLWI